MILGVVGVIWVSPGGTGASWRALGSNTVNEMYVCSGDMRKFLRNFLMILLEYSVIPHFPWHPGRWLD